MVEGHSSRVEGKWSRAEGKWLRVEKFFTIIIERRQIKILCLVEFPASLTLTGIMCRNIRVILIAETQWFSCLIFLSLMTS